MSVEYLNIVVPAFVLSWFLYKLIWIEGIKNSADDTTLKSLRVFSVIFAGTLAIITGLLTIFNTKLIDYQPDKEYIFSKRNIYEVQPHPTIAGLTQTVTFLPDKQIKEKIPKPIPWRKELLRLYNLESYLGIIIMGLFIFIFLHFFVIGLSASLFHTIFNSIAIMLFIYGMFIIFGPEISLEEDRRILSVLQMDDKTISSEGTKVIIATPITLGDNQNITYQIPNISSNRITKLTEWAQQNL